MLNLSCLMNIGGYSFNFVNEIEIVSTWEQMTDTATVKIPKALTLRKNGVVDNVITAGPDALWKRGDSINIQLGYNNVLDNRFTGVLTKIRPNKPLEFQCEDLMWRLKQITIKKLKYTSVTIAQLLKDIIPSDIKFTSEDITIGKFIVEQATVAEVLDYIRKTFGLSVYFQNGALYVGFAYASSKISDFVLSDIKEFNFQVNIIDYENLDYIREQDQNLRVTAINILKNNTRQQIDVGDTFGDQRTLYYFNLSQTDVKKLATEQLEKLKYTGFRGSFTTFLRPYVKHGDAIKLVDDIIPDRNGIYLVRKVVTTFGMGGGRQEITLDRKIG